MPMYKWMDKNTGYEIVVYRSSFSEYQDPPKEEELPEEERGKEREWKRLIEGKFILTNPNKGNW